MGTKKNSEYLTVALRIAKSAGAMISEAFSQSKTVETKSNFRDLVTKTDKEVEEFVFDELRKEFPSHDFIGEESVDQIHLTKSPTWIVDPIDGTVNFVHGIPHLCISIAFLIGRETRVAVVFNPLSNDLYWAEKGQGAFHNGQKIQVSGNECLSNSIVICDVWAAKEEAKIRCTLDNMRALVNEVRSFRSFGSAVLNMCFVARGISDACLEYGIHCWDMAAAILIVDEAGGVVMDPTGGVFDLLRRRVLVCSSTPLARHIVPLLSHVEYEKEGVLA